MRHLGMIYLTPVDSKEIYNPLHVAEKNCQMKKQ